MKYPGKLALAALIGATCALSACGGGGGDSEPHDDAQGTELSSQEVDALRWLLEANAANKEGMQALSDFFSQEHVDRLNKLAQEALPAIQETTNALHQMLPGKEEQKREEEEREKYKDAPRYGGTWEIPELGMKHYFSGYFLPATDIAGIHSSGPQESGTIFLGGPTPEQAHMINQVWDGAINGKNNEYSQLSDQEQVEYSKKAFKGRGVFDIAFTFIPIFEYGKYPITGDVEEFSKNIGKERMAMVQVPIGSTTVSGKTRIVNYLAKSGTVTVSYAERANHYRIDGPLKLYRVPDLDDREPDDLPDSITLIVDGMFERYQVLQ